MKLSLHTSEKTLPYLSWEIPKFPFVIQLLRPIFKLTMEENFLNYISLSADFVILLWNQIIFAKIVLLDKIVFWYNILKNMIRSQILLLLTIFCLFLDKVNSLEFYKTKHILLINRACFIKNQSERDFQT